MKEGSSRGMLQREQVYGKPRRKALGFANSQAVEIFKMFFQEAVGSEV